MTSVRRIASVGFLTLALWFGVDALLFRTNLYPSILEPDSTAGEYELILMREREFFKRHGSENLVATLGDSRFAYAPRLANELTSRTGYVFRHAGVAGTNPRTWFYMMRDLDPAANHYKALVIGLTSFDDEDGPANPVNGPYDLHYVIARLRLADTLEFARSYDDRQLQWVALRGGLFKGFVLQPDIQEFLKSPADRIRRARMNRRGYDWWTYTFQETERSMSGFQIDWQTGRYTAPPDADQEQKDSVQAVLYGRGYPQTGRLGAFYRVWLGRLLDRYRGSPTKIIFVRLPRGPVPAPEGMLQARSAVVREFAQRPNVMLAPEHRFDELERPELFKDAVHLNRAGIARFSPLLAEQIAGMLSGSSGN
jgi:hypothetical protein